VIEHFRTRGEVERVKTFLVGQLIEEYGKVGSLVISFVARILMISHAKFFLPSYLREELLGIARITTPHGLSYFDLLALNYGGDLVANCTSAVVGLERPLHIRNMDWFPRESLVALSAQFNFHGSSGTVFSSTGWCFFVGTHTVMTRDKSENGVSISMNFRLVDNGVHHNLARFVAGYWPQALLIRHIAQSQTGYTEVVGTLQRVPLIAPCYFVVAGPNRNDGCVLERDGGRRLAAMQSLGDAGYRQCVGVTNCDATTKRIPLSWTHDDPLLMNALRRRRCMFEFVERHFREPAQFDDPSRATDAAQAVLKAEPINNYQTCFGTIMSPGHNTYSSWCWPPAADSRSLDTRLGGGYDDVELERLGVTRS